MNEKNIEVKFEKIVPDGMSLGRYEGKPLDKARGKVVFAFGVLPGETAVISPMQQKRNYMIGKVEKILEKSPSRIEPVENHFLSCSPWQILDPKDEIYWKKEIAKELFRQNGLEHINLDPELVMPDDLFGYRNKMEYHFVLDETEKLSLGFFGRNEKRKIPISPCILAHESLNKTALEILNWLKEENVRIEFLKTLIIRSNLAGETIAGLFVKDKEFAKTIKIPEFNFAGLQIFYSNPQSPASTTDEILYKAGQDFLTEKLNGKNFKFGLMSFFQVNVFLFEKALAEIEKFIEKEDEVVDYYSGVGAIGLSLAEKCKKIILVEENKEAGRYALENIESNGIKNAEAFTAQAEKMRQFISENKTIIFDPTRSGLHPKIIKEIMLHPPKRIIYLSCNIATQARDLKSLSDLYKINFWKLYNFFPRTPHIESLIVMERK